MKGHEAIVFGVGGALAGLTVQPIALSMAWAFGWPERASLGVSVVLLVVLMALVDVRLGRRQP